MEKVITLKPIQSEMINKLSHERDVIILRLDDLIRFTLAGEDVDPSQIVKTEIRGNEFIIVMK